MSTESFFNTRELNQSNWYLRYTTLALVFIFVLLLVNPVYNSLQEKLYNKSNLMELEKRVVIIEEQVKLHQDLRDSYILIENQMTDLLSELSYLKYNLPSVNTLEKINQEVQNQNHRIQVISEKIESTLNPDLVSFNFDKILTDDQYYVVKRGDNLTQISKKTGISIWELKEINNIDSNYTIFPGQRLKLR